MADLRTLISGLGFEQVKTLLNSGNAVFCGQQTKTTTLATTLRAAVLDRTAVDARVTVLTADELQQVAADNPFANTDVDPSRMLVSVLADPRDGSDLAPMQEQDWGTESFALGTRAAYTLSPAGVLASQCLKQIEKTMGGRATTRNLRTLNKLVALF